MNSSIEEEEEAEEELRLNSFQIYKLKKIAHKIANKLNKQIENGNATGAFMIAIALAVFKDFEEPILEFTGIGLAISLPLGILISLTLTFFMWGKGWFLKTKVWVLWFIFGLFFDNLPLFSILPLETILVLYAWKIVRDKANEAEEKKVRLERLTHMKIEKLSSKRANIVGRQLQLLDEDDE